MSIPIVGLEQLHLHTDIGSLLDGYGRPIEYANRAKSINQQYLCITDHGAMAAIPQQLRACDKFGLKHIFGMEAYVQPMQPTLKDGEKPADFAAKLAPDDKKPFRKNFHLLLIVKNEEGYKNLVHLHNEAWTAGFYGKPRINHEQLQKYRSGLIMTSCCYMGEIGQAFDRGGDELGFAKVQEYIDKFGREDFYLEFMLLDWSKQRAYNEFIMRCHDRFGLPLLVTQDTHYPEEADSKMQSIMLMMQTKRTMADMEQAIRAGKTDEFFELQDKNLWMKSEEELNAKWLSDYSSIIDYDLFAQAKLNTIEVARMCEGVQIDRSVKLPQLPDEADKLRSAIMRGAAKRGIPLSEKYLSRIKEEFELFERKGFLSYFLIQQAMVEEARRAAVEMLGYSDGSQAIGPCRGSAGGSLICYLLGITGIDPIEHDLLFSRFLAPSRGGKLYKLRFNGQPVDSQS